MGAHQPRIGTAGWSIRAEHRDVFPAEGSHLQRYAARFNAVEINSSFYRPHRRSTYRRWADTVGADFRFSVKLPKTVSHAGLASPIAETVRRFADEVAGLGEKLGVILIQFPPSLAFDIDLAADFFRTIGSHIPGRLACEPRHRSWFDEDANAMLAGLRIARVAADPAVSPDAAVPGGWQGLRYHRLHGSPDIYRTEYGMAAIQKIYSAVLIEAESGEPWCIFDNTTFGFATSDALKLRGHFFDPDRRCEHR
jgi:uncharacterized protein YecE (DUF72 family)